MVLLISMESVPQTCICMSTSFFQTMLKLGEAEGTKSFPLHAFSGLIQQRMQEEEKGGGNNLQGNVC